MIELIRKLVAPKNWAAPNAYSTLVGAALVVRQTLEVHNQTQNLLDAVSAADHAGAVRTPAASQLRQPVGKDASPTPSGAK